MTGVLTLFGETHLQEALQKAFVKNDLIFEAENAVTSVQLLSYAEQNAQKTDVVIIAASAVTLSSIFDLIDDIRSIKESMRIIVILNGGREQYLKSQLSEFRTRGIDIIFDDRGFDIDRLIQFAKKGPIKKQRDKDEIIEKTAADILRDTKNTLLPNEKDDDRNDESEQFEDSKYQESFSQFQGHYCIGIMSSTRGAGATMLAYNIANCFAVQDCRMAIVDYTGTESLSVVKIKGVDYVSEPQSLRQLRKKYNLVIIDFGTPYLIPPKGDNFKMDEGYPMLNMQEFVKCNIKIIMGLSSPWNIRKFTFFLENNQWKSISDSSFVYLLDADAKRIKRRYPSFNICNRNDNIVETIYEIIRQEEMK